MTLKSDTKFWEESTCHFKIDKRNLTNFDLSTESLKNFPFKELFFMTLKRNAKFAEELTCCFKIDMGNLTNSDSST